MPAFTGIVTLNYDCSAYSALDFRMNQNKASKVLIPTSTSSGSGSTRKDYVAPIIAHYHASNTAGVLSDFTLSNSLALPSLCTYKCVAVTANWCRTETRELCLRRQQSRIT